MRISRFVLVIILILQVSAVFSATFTEKTGFNDREGVGEGPTNTPVFEAKPYLQNMTTDGVTLAWQAQIMARAEVTVSRGDWSESYATVNSRRLNHVRIDGLEPDTRYEYRVTLLGEDGKPGDSIAGADRWFRTFPAKKRDLKFALLADCGHEQNGHAERYGALMTTLSKEPDLDFVMFAGDMVQSGWPTEWVPDLLEPGNVVFSKTPFFAVYGNHESNSPFFFHYLDLPMNERYYSFDVLDYHIIGIDSNTDFTEGSEQYNWLIDDLKSSATKTKILVCHHPTFGSGWHSAVYENNQIKEIPIRTARTLFPKLAKEYGITAFFCGHEHNYEHNEINGVHYIVTGGGGSNGCSREGAEKTLGNWGGARYGVMHYSLVTVSGGRAHYQAKGINGEVIDEFGLCPVTTTLQLEKR